MPYTHLITFVEAGFTVGEFVLFTQRDTSGLNSKLRTLPSAEQEPTVVSIFQTRGQDPKVKLDCLNEKIVECGSSVSAGNRA